MTKDEWILAAIADGAYRVERDGRVIRQHARTERAVKTHKHPKTGYLQFTMSWRNQQKCVLLHRLVALVHIPNPLNLPDVNHDDGVKTNCAVSNLEWTTKSANMKHAYNTGLRSAAGERNGAAKLTESDAREIRSSSIKNSLLASRFGVSARTIRDIVNGRTWREI